MTSLATWLIDLVRDAHYPMTSMIEDLLDGTINWMAGFGAELSWLAAEVRSASAGGDQGSGSTMQNAWGVKVVHISSGNGMKKRFIDGKRVEFVEL